MIYTSYYAHVRNMNDNKFKFIAISNSVPYWFEKPLIRERQLAPVWESVVEYRSTKDRNAFRAKYLAGIDNLVSVLSKIEMAAEAEGKIPVLLCYEADADVCHRGFLIEAYPGRVVEMV